jgi:FlaA1/EpsC-like NDP-sugar epimerase
VKSQATAGEGVAVLSRKRSTRNARGLEVLQRLANIRPALILSLQDTILLSAAAAFALLFRYDGEVSAQAWKGLLEFLPLAVVIFVGVSAVGGVYGQLWRYASVIEARRVLLAGCCSTALIVALDFVHRFVPLTVALVAGLAATMLVGLARFQTRLVSFRRRADDHQEDQTSRAGLNVVVVGAGRSGAELIRQMQSHEHSGLVPVAVVDDDRRTWGRTLHGIRVKGALTDLPELLTDLDVHQIVLADAQASPDTVSRIAAIADSAGVALRILPATDELVRSGLRLRDVRDLRIDDLLGRDPVNTDFPQIAALLQGRRVLVTGAGGSIGSEICRQVARCGPGLLVLLDHDETHLHDVLATLPVPGVPELVDIRDAARLSRVLHKHKPHVVFHAAAHKHVPMLESAPSEAVMTNVVGSANLIEAAEAVGVSHLVLISTDKAVHPSSVMGASKSIAEQLVLTSAQRSSRAWCGVRFGNVLGSRGSVIPTFSQQIEAGGPVIVTDARMTRYFMTIPEAVQLVLQAAAMSRGAELFMLEMGRPVRILDLAHKMIRLSGRRPGTDVEIRIGGMRPGEKLHEELRIPEESLFPTGHPSVLRLEPVILDESYLADRIAHLRRLAEADDTDELRTALLAAAPDRDPESAETANFVIQDNGSVVPSPRERAAALAEGHRP